jgi:hypothetical protein
MTKALREQSESTATQISCDLGPFEQLIWLVDQWTARHFISSPESRALQSQYGI